LQGKKVQFYNSETKERKKQAMYKEEYQFEDQIFSDNRLVDVIKDDGSDNSELKYIHEDDGSPEFWNSGF
jgi:hypothetical protein